MSRLGVTYGGGHHPMVAGHGVHSSLASRAASAAATQGPSRTSSRSTYSVGNREGGKSASRRPGEFAFRTISHNGLWARRVRPRRGYYSGAVGVRCCTGVDVSLVRNTLRNCEVVWQRSAGKRTSQRAPLPGFLASCCCAAQRKPNYSMKSRTGLQTPET